MKKARLILSASMLTVFAFASATMVSCNKDEKDTTCPLGKEGENCETLSRDKFIGIWDGTDECDSSSVEYIMTIDTSSTNTLNVLISNPSAYGDEIKVTGNLTASNVVTLTNVDVGGQRTMSGTFTVNGNTLTTEYVVTPSVGNADHCSGTFTKQ